LKKFKIITSEGAWCIKTYIVNAKDAGEAEDLVLDGDVFPENVEYESWEDAQGNQIDSVEEIK